MAQPDVKEERNLSVIQRLDKDVLRVIGYASHVVIYIFNEEEKVGNFRCLPTAKALDSMETK